MNLLHIPPGDYAAYLPWSSAFCLVEITWDGTAYQLDPHTLKRDGWLKSEGFSPNTVFQPVDIEKAQEQLSGYFAGGGKAFSVPASEAVH